MTNFRTDPNGADPSDARTGDVAEPGRLVGQVFNDIYFERNPKSPWYGEPRPIAGIPVGIYARRRRHALPERRDGDAATTPEQLAAAHDGDHEPRRLVRGARALDRDAQLPDPAGSVPRHVPGHGRRPGYERAPERDYNPNLLTANDAGGGVAGPDHPARPPLDPISGTACEDPAVPSRGPSCSRSRVRAVPSCRRPAAGRSRSRATSSAPRDRHRRDRRCTSTSPTRATARCTTLTRANGGVVSWTPGTGEHAGHDRHPGAGLASTQQRTSAERFRPGPKQLTIVTSARERRRVQRQRHHASRARHERHRRERRHLHADRRQRAGAAAVAGEPTTRSRTRSTRARRRQPARARAGHLQRERARVEAAEDPGPRPRRHHRRARAPGPRPRGPAVPRQRLGHRRPLLPAERRPPSTRPSSAHAPYAVRRGASRRVLRGADITVVAKTTTAYDLHGATDMLARRGADRRPRPHDRPRRRRRRHPAAGQRQQHADHQRRAREQRRRRRRRHRPRPAVRATAATTTTSGSPTTG